MNPLEDKKENYWRLLARGSGITFIGLITVSIAAFVVRVFLAQGLSKAEFGLFFAIFSFLALLNTVSLLGLGSGVTKFISKFKAEKKPNQVKSSIISSLSIVAGVSLSIAALIIFFSKPLALAYFGTGRAILILIILSVWFFLMSLHSFFLSILQGLKDFFGRTLGLITRSLVPLIGIVSFGALFNLDLTSAAIFYLLGPILSVPLLLAFLKQRHYYVIDRVSGSISFSRSKEMLKFSLPLLFSGMAVSIIGRTDTLMLTGLRSLGDVGLYEVARVTRTVLVGLGTALTIPLFPMISELWAKENLTDLRNILRHITKFAFILVVPFSLVFIAFPQPIINLFFGAEYLEAANAMRFLSFAIIFWIMGKIFWAALSGMGKPTFVLKSIGIAAAVNVPMNFILIPPYGATGAALATGMSFLVLFGLQLYYSSREIRFPFPSSDLVKIGIGGGITLLLIYFLKSVLILPDWPKLLVIFLLSALFYLLWLFMTRIVTKKDLNVIGGSVPIPRKIFIILEKLVRE